MSYLSGVYDGRVTQSKSRSQYPSFGEYRVMRSSVHSGERAILVAVLLQLLEDHEALFTGNSWRVRQMYREKGVYKVTPPMIAAEKARLQRDMKTWAAEMAEDLGIVSADIWVRRAAYIERFGCPPKDPSALRQQVKRQLVNAHQNPQAQKRVV